MLQKIKRIDAVIVIILVVLMGISLFSIYSVTYGREGMDGFHIKMLRNYIMGFTAFLGLAFFDYRLLVKYALYIYLFGIAVLVLTKFFGHEEHGSQGWLKFGGFGLQPAELFKLILILFLAAVLYKKNKENLQFWKDIVPLGLLALLPFTIVILQNDLGNAISYVVILGGLLWVGNIKFSHALIGALIIGGTLGASIFSYITYHEPISAFLKEWRPHFVERFDPWLVPDKATEKAIYHTKNAKIAIASGGMSGEGYMQGTSVQSKRIPYTYSDSIFVQIAEEFGFLGSAVLLLLFFILIHRMILIALECRDRAGPFIIIGVVAMLLYQIFENIGPFLGLMPLTGITLPFISYGGTSLLINMASMGIVMSVHLYGQDAGDSLAVPLEYVVQSKS